MNLRKLAYAIYYWFTERNIPTENLVVILNMSDRNAAAHLDFEIKKEMADIMWFTDKSNTLKTGEFKLHGINFKVESPLHAITE